MAKSKAKESTREEKAVKTLEDAFNTNLIGSNMLKRDPYAFGQIGNQAGNSTYDESMESEEAGKILDGLYKEKKQDARRKGIAGDVPRPDNYDAMNYVMGIVQENQMILPLGDLEKVVTKVAGPLGESVDEDFKDVTFVDVQKSVMNKKIEAEKSGKKYEMDKKEKYVLNMFSALRQAYETGSAKKVFDGAYLSPITDAMKQINEEYRPTPENASA